MRAILIDEGKDEEQVSKHLIALVRLLYPLGEFGLKADLTETCALIEKEMKALSSFDEQDALCVSFAIRLALAQHSVTRETIEGLKASGFSEHEVHDLGHVAACFAYMNRVAAFSGVRVDEARDEYARELLGDGAFERHLAWVGLGRDR